MTVGYVMGGKRVVRKRYAAKADWLKAFIYKALRVRCSNPSSAWRSPAWSVPEALLLILKSSEMGDGFKQTPVKQVVRRRAFELA